MKNRCCGFLLSVFSAVAISMFFTPQAFAILDAEVYFGYSGYEGKMLDDIPTSKGKIDGSSTEMGASAHLYLIPFIPIGIGVFGSLATMDKISGNVQKTVSGTDVEFFSFESEPSLYTGGLEIAVNSPIALFIDPYFRAGFGGLFGSAPTTITAPTNAVTTEAGFAGKEKKLDSMKIAGAFWHALLGLKFTIGIPFFRLGAEMGYRSIMAMGIINSDASDVPTSIDYNNFDSDLSKFPFAGAYQDVNGFFGRVGLIFDF